MNVYIQLLNTNTNKILTSKISLTKGFILTRFLGTELTRFIV